MQIKNTVHVKNINNEPTELTKAEIKNRREKASKKGEPSTVESKNTRIARLIKKQAANNVKETGEPTPEKKPKRVNRAVNSRETEAVGNPAKPRKNKEKLEYLQEHTLPEEYGVTAQEEIYIQELNRGNTQVQAYRIAFPKSRRWKENSVKSAASKLFNDERVRTRYNDLLRALRQRETEVTEWTRDSSRQALEKLYRTTAGEMDRINAAYENQRALEMQALEQYQKMLNDDSLSKKDMERVVADIMVLNKRMIDNDKERRISSIHVDGVVKPITEINRMYGYNEENLDMNQVVIFVGEELIED